MAELRTLADRIFDSHDRYLLVRAPKPEVAALFDQRRLCEC